MCIKRVIELKNGSSLDVASAPHEWWGEVEYINDGDVVNGSVSDPCWVQMRDERGQVRAIPFEMPALRRALEDAQVQSEDAYLKALCWCISKGVYSLTAVNGDELNESLAWQLKLPDNVSLRLFLELKAAGATAERTGMQRGTSSFPNSLFDLLGLCIRGGSPFNALSYRS